MLPRYNHRNSKKNSVLDDLLFRAFANHTAIAAVLNIRRHCRLLLVSGLLAKTELQVTEYLGLADWAFTYIGPGSNISAKKKIKQMRFTMMTS
jgi:hypothetical protein